MSRFTNPRRWASQSKRKKRDEWTESNITPQEAYAAMHAIVLQTGHNLERVYEYDPLRDRFKIVARDSNGKLVDITIFGETVAGVVAYARAVAGQPGGLKHYSERKYAVR